MKTKNPVDPMLLKHFGFRKMKCAHGGFDKGCWYNIAFEIDNGLYYDPNSHTTKEFARNLVNAIQRLTIKRSFAGAAQTAKIILGDDIT
jgi:ABC-type sulfate transport system substrate-binding protein